MAVLYPPKTLKCMNNGDDHTVSLSLPCGSLGVSYPIEIGYSFWSHLFEHHIAFSINNKYPFTVTLVCFSPTSQSLAMACF